MRLIGLGIKAEEVDGASAPRSGTDMRHFLAQQGIDQAGFADVRSAEKSEFRRTFRGKEFGIGSGGKKFGDNRLHSGNKQFSQQEEIAKIAIIAKITEIETRRRSAQREGKFHHGGTETRRKTNYKNTKRRKVRALDFVAYFPIAAPMKASFAKRNWSVFKPRYLWPVFLMRRVSQLIAISRCGSRFQKKSGPRCYGPKGFALA